MDLPTEQNHLPPQELILSDEFLSGSKSVSERAKPKAGMGPSSGSCPVLKKPTEAAEESFVEFPDH